SSSFPANGSGVTNFSPTQFALNIGNVAPTASIVGGPFNVNEGGGLSLSTTASDADGDNLTYSWDINGDGTYGDATGANPTVTWSQLASLGVLQGTVSTANIRVEVGDGHGHVVTSSAVGLTVHDNPVVAASYFDSAVYEIDARTGVVVKTLVAPNSQATLQGP